MSNLNWTTEFDTAKNQMSHLFNNDVTVITDFRLRLVYVTHKGDNKDTIPLEAIEEIDRFVDFLTTTARYASQL